jgi:hypothetical protein
MGYPGRRADESGFLETDAKPSRRGLTTRPASTQGCAAATTRHPGAELLLTGRAGHAVVPQPARPPMRLPVITTSRGPPPTATSMRSVYFQSFVARFRAWPQALPSLSGPLGRHRHLWAGYPAIAVALGAGGADTYSRRAIPGSDLFRVRERCRWSCFRILVVICDAWSADVRGRMLASIAVVTRSRDSGLTTWLRTTGAYEDRTTSAASERRLWW